jgi:ligand-binding SRPBCC domain-containing protein
MEINSNAPVISRHEITINAPLESVWLLHTEIDAWPQ